MCVRAALMLSLFFALVLSSHGYVVQTKLGPVLGTTDPASGTALFLGIPYAQPPVGALRWQAPVVHAPWTATLACTSFGAMCPQNADASGYTFPPGATFDEDCLSLNVYVPKTTTNRTGLRAVFVW